MTAAAADLVSTIFPAADARLLMIREEAAVGTLLEAARGGDREAFGSLVALHERVALRTALAVLGVREDAEDVTQEAFVSAWQKLGTFRGDATFRTWLLTIVWRRALSRRRVRQLWQHRTHIARAWEETDAIDAVAASSPDPERAAVSRDLADRVRRQIAALTPKLRDTLLLAATGEHSYEEIAAMLKIPLGTAKWRVAEARRVLTRRLALPGA